MWEGVTLVSAGSLCILMYSAIKPDDFFNGYRRSGFRLQGLQHCSETSETVWSTELRDLRRVWVGADVVGFGQALHMFQCSQSLGAPWDVDAVPPHYS